MSDKKIYSPKNLTLEQFSEAIDAIQKSDRTISERTLEIAKGVLVEGQKQVFYVRKYDMTPPAVSQAVKIVRDAYLKMEKTSYNELELVSGLLPPHLAFQFKCLVKKYQPTKKKGSTSKQKEGKGVI